MEHLPKAVLTALFAGLAFAGLGHAWQASARRGGPAADAALNSAVDGVALDARPLERAVTQALPQRESRPSPAPVTVAFENGLLSIEADGASLKDVLAVIARSTGVAFASSGDMDESLSIGLGPRPLKEAISELLSHTSYGYAFVDWAGHAGRVGLSSVLLIQRANTGSAPGRLAVQPAWDPAAPSAPGQGAQRPPPPDEAALQQQRAVDALFNACKGQACDSS